MLIRKNKQVKKGKKHKRIIFYFIIIFIDI